MNFNNVAKKVSVRKVYTLYDTIYINVENVIWKHIFMW